MDLLIRDTIRNLLQILLLFCIGIIFVSTAMDMTYDRYHYCEAGYNLKLPHQAGCNIWLFEAGSKRAKVQVMHKPPMIY